jgi:phosphoglycerol transferase MdoB-like AlkP superfamily enzyme
MKNYYAQIGNVLYRLLIVLLMFSISRLFFFALNYHLFVQAGWFELLKIFFFGVRFDATAVFEINLVFVVLYLLPFSFVRNKYYARTLNILFYTVNALVLLLNFTDAEYFKFIAKRSTADLFSYLLMSNDAVVLMPQFIKDFWYVPLAWIATVVLGIVLMRRLPFNDKEALSLSCPNVGLSFVLMILLSGLLVLMARGTGLKPVRLVTATHYTSSQNIPLLLNTPFCIIHTMNDKGDQAKMYYPESQLSNIYTPEQKFENTTLRHDNVVVIILESFSREFVGSITGGKTYTPNLDSIIRQGLVFENAFANGKRSIDAMPAVFAGVLSVQDEAFVSSRYSTNTLEAMPKMLAENGYHTAFFHGGRNGTMSFDEFARIAGFKEYYGLNEYKGPEAFDGSWGIQDEEFLQFFGQKLNSFTQPFMASIFTLSSHHPYKVPSAYEHAFPAGETNLQHTIRYADMALGKFFKAASKMPWYKNTLFILTADHTASDENEIADNKLNTFRIPIVYFHPGGILFKGRSKRITQQTDIMPSVYDYLGINKPFVAYGNSVFSKDTSWAEYFLSDIFTFIEGNTAITFDGERTIATERLTDTRTDSVPAEKLEYKLKAIIQQSQMRLFNNKMTIQLK